VAAIEPGPPAALGWFHRALSGRDAELVTYPAGGDVLQYADTAAAVRLPERAPAVAGLDEAGWYRVALAHRSLHDLLGSFAPELDLAVVMDRYPRALLAGDLYAVLEDVRVDAAADRLLPGLRGDLDAVRTAELRARPYAAALPARAAVAEVLVQYSLGAPTVRIPATLVPAVRAVARAAAPLREAHAGAADSLRATAAVYRVLARLHNAEPERGPSVLVDLGVAGRGSEPPVLEQQPTSTAGYAGPDLAVVDVVITGRVDQ
jgi:hypothetical protein